MLKYLEGAYNVIFRADGRLIAPPDRMEEGPAKEGLFNILESGDPILREIHRLVTANPGANLLEHEAADAYLAVATNEEPNWYFVVVFPRSVVTGLALRTAHR